ncbi:PP2C family protein-serine/threonine phosphatase [Gymnodinialimonas ceratoperidinii]|uniref:Protein phosphatase 2C domain-containing protein n=1 Tax=Gymnodinialimonas ceratoperidinii TaxID=2856823 RepID=A0A8F6Y9V0_9RHOB|nr:protein phosphatase 2C domain-containing protein [Gymnodinialimonas ceratoperidinii]QXT38918.1 protein phosphatase 2C domain-containing protein [Gymnodinialimonas ceratoperidinii]
MSPTGYDVATALWQGARPYQEDTLLADFHGGMDRGFAVLADGMGGHAAGDLASRLAVIDAASHLKFLIHDGPALEKTLHAELTSAIETANEVLRDRAADDPRLKGMGTTFLATVIFEDRLYWASVGDSPLYLWRENGLRRLNADHSMAPVIDQMARAGEITEAEATAHPDRNALTSVLMGRPLKAMDVPETATVLDPGDVLVQASDGVQFLDDKKISAIIGKAVAAGESSAGIARALIAALQERDDPTQDNTAIMVLQLTHAAGAGGGAHAGAAASGVVASERAVGTAAATTPRAATPTDIPRPAGARRWPVPVALLSGAAAMAAVAFVAPGVFTPQDPARAPETLEIAAAPEPAPEPEPSPEAAPAPVPAPPAASLAPGTASSGGEGSAGSVGTGTFSAVEALTAAPAPVFDDSATAPTTAVPTARPAPPSAPVAEVADAVAAPVAVLPVKFAARAGSPSLVPQTDAPAVAPLREGISAPVAPLVPEAQPISEREQRLPSASDASRRSGG